MRINDKTLNRIERSLGRDGVWVAPDLRKKVPLRVEHKIERAVDGAKPKVYAVLVEVPARNPAYRGSMEKLIKAVRPEVGPGMYVGVDKNMKLMVASHGPGSGQTAFFAREAAKRQHPGDIAAQVVSASRLVANGEARSTYQRLNKPERVDNGQREQGLGTVEPSTTSPSTVASASSGADDGDGPWVTIGIGVVLAIVVIGVVGALLVRRKGGSIADSAAPAPVLAVTHALRRRRYRRRARREVRALGRRLDDASVSAGSEAFGGAVEHHAIARRIIDGPHSPADAVGVIVLARRGHDALDAAEADRSWKPMAPCYLNPMHGWSDRHVSWRGAAGGLELPACKACADTIDAGRMPDDVLDFLHRGRPRHYFALVLEPWTSTGFGSLETDLLPLLHSRPR